MFGTRPWVRHPVPLQSCRVGYPASVRAYNVTFVMWYVTLRTSVDRFVPTMASCIADDDVMIRKHAVITLTQVCRCLSIA